MILIPPVMKWADRIGAIDIPDARKVHTVAIPRVGGIAMVIGSIVSILLLVSIDARIISILVGYMVIWIFGVWDDKCDINYKIKFIGQLLAVVIVVYFGDVVITNFPFVDEEIPSYLAIPFTIFALVGITNAINLTDGLDGLAGGTSLITISMIALLAYDAGSESIVLISMAVAGSILGFLRHNTYPARLFMGDTGSQFLGFSLGVLVIYLSQLANSAMSPLIPLIILGLPVLDTVAVIVQRLYENRSPFSADKNHIHHKLLEVGFDQYEAVFIIYLIQTSLITIAYFMLYESDMMLLAIYSIFSVLVLGVFHFTHASGNETNKVGKKYSALSNIINKMYSYGVVTLLPTRMLKIIVPTLLLMSVIFARDIENDIVILSAVLLVFITISLSLNFRYSVVTEKAVIYIVSAMAIYLMPSSAIDGDIYYIVNILFICLVIFFTLRVRFSSERSFEVTPLDYLVIILVISVPNLPEVQLEDSRIGEMAIKLVILLYAVESVMGSNEKSVSYLRVSAVGALAFVLSGVFNY